MDGGMETSREGAGGMGTKQGRGRRPKVEREWVGMKTSKEGVWGDRKGS